MWKSYLLAEASILKDKNFTISLDKEYFIKNELRNPFNFSNYIDDGVVIDKNIITAKANYFIDFTIKFCSLLNLFYSNESKTNTHNWFKGINYFFS